MEETYTYVNVERATFKIDSIKSLYVIEVGNAVGAHIVVISKAKRSTRYRLCHQVVGYLLWICASSN